MKMISKMDIFISYVIPCYNVGKYLPKCMESLSKQDIKEGAGIEFVFVNDGSKDDTLMLLKDFASKDCRVQIIDQKNQGVSAARNNGLKRSKGEYVFFLDGDDFLTDDASQIVYDSCKCKPDILITCAYRVVEGAWEDRIEWNPCKGIQKGLYSINDFVNSVKLLPMSFKAYRHEILKHNNVCFDEDLRVGEVYTFFLHAMAYSNTIYYTNEHILNYVIRGGSVMRTFDIERDRTIIKTMHRIDEYGNLFGIDIKNQDSYHKSLFGIVNKFSLGKFLDVMEYTPEMNEFAMSVKNDKVYKRTLSYFLKTLHFGSKFLDVFILNYFPVKMYYQKKKIYYQKKKMKRYLKVTLKNPFHRA